MKRILKKIILTGGIILLIALIIYIITNKPAVSKKIELSIIHDYPGSERLKSNSEEEIKSILSGDTSGDVVRLGKGLPEEWEEGKLVSMVIHLTMRNITPFPLDNISATFKEKSEESNILFTWEDLKTQWQKPFSKKDISIMWFEMYCGDMDYEQIREYLSERTAIVRYTIPLFGTHSMEIPLKDIEITKILKLNDEGYMVNILED